ncbi:MAG: ribosomal protein S18-alanine N-acetyltransferase [Pygmaiobacter sp.]
METLRFVPLAKEHVAALAKLDETAPDPWNEPEIAAELTKPACRCTVALLQGEPVAFGCFWRTGETADLATLSVRQQNRRCGIGRALLKAALAALQAEGVCRVLLEVRCSNAPAIALYESLGFERLAQRKALYTKPMEDGFLMERVF